MVAHPDGNADGVNIEMSRLLIASQLSLHTEHVGASSIRASPANNAFKVTNFVTIPDNITHFENCAACNYL